MGKKLIINGADFSYNAIDRSIVYPYTIPQNDFRYYASDSFFGVDHNTLKWIYKRHDGDGAQWAYIDISPYKGKYITINTVPDSSFRILFLKDNRTYVNFNTTNSYVNVSSDDKTTSYPDRISTNPGTPYLIEDDMNVLSFATKLSDQDVAVEIIITE